MSIQNYDLFKAITIIANFANMDTTERLCHSLRAYCDYDDSGFFPYETLLGKTMNIMSGITSSLSYMHLSIYQISQSNLDEVLEKEGYTDYDIYRYHYIVFSHSVALLQDLMFKLSSEIFNLDLPERMIGWKKLQKELNKHDLTILKSILEGFYTKFSIHINKRNGFSHEGLLSYKALDNFYMTYVWGHAHSVNDDKENKYPQYTKGSLRNAELLKTTKENFLKELRELENDAESFVISLCDECFAKLLEQIDFEFYKKHVSHFKEINNPSLNKHLSKIGL